MLRCKQLCTDLDTDALAELSIHLHRANAGDYERLLGGIDLGAVCDEVTCADDPPRRELRELLTRTRVGDVSPRVRARLVHALMDGPTCSLAEQALVSVFRETAASQLTALKLAVDAGYPDDMLRLVYDDVDDEALRAELIERCAAASGGGRLLLTDVDDTLFPSLNDSRYASDRLYPGVRALLRALSTGQPAVVGLLTARPGPLGELTVRRLKQLGVPVSLALTGTFAGLRSHSAMAANKREAFLAYRGLYPELQTLFCGDTGQGDGEAILALLAEGALDQALLHDVVGLEPEQRARYEAEGVLVFETYLGAATALEAAGWLEPDQLLRVARFALAELRGEALEPESSLQSAWDRDVAAAEARLGRPLH